jgi:hypothetical protein
LSIAICSLVLSAGEGGDFRRRVLGLMADDDEGVPFERRST